MNKLISIPDDVAVVLKHQAVDEGKSFSKLVTDILVAEAEKVKSKKPTEHRPLRNFLDIDA